MSTEEKAENICRSIGIAMYVQKEDADMQKENRVGTRKEAGKTRSAKKNRRVCKRSRDEGRKKNCEKKKGSVHAQPETPLRTFGGAGARTGRDGRGAAVSEALYRSGGRTDDHGITAVTSQMRLACRYRIR